MTAKKPKSKERPGKPHKDKAHDRPSKPKTPKPRALKPGSAKPEAKGPVTRKPERPRPEHAKPEKKEAARPVEQEKEKPRPGPAEPEPSKQEPARPAAPREERPKPSPAKPEGERPAGKAPEHVKPEHKAPPGPGVNMLMFNRWDVSNVKVSDAGLRGYINLTPILVPRTGGKYGSGQFQKNKMSIVERFMNKLMVSGHRGRKHKLTSGRHLGKTPMLYKTMKDAFAIVEKRTNQNPVQVLVTAIENSALLEEVASYRLGGIIARNAVITSPQRRLDIALRHLTQGIYRSSFKNRQGLAEVIANELVAAFSNDTKSFAISERNRIEKEAEGAR